jgi:hypothetical protein
MADFACHDIVMLRDERPIRFVRDKKTIGDFCTLMGQMLSRTEASLQAFNLTINDERGAVGRACWRAVAPGAGHLWWTFGDGPKVDALAAVLFARDPVVDGLALSTLKDKFGFEPPEHARREMAEEDGPRVYNFYFTERALERGTVTAGVIGFGQAYYRMVWPTGSE